MKPQESRLIGKLPVSKTGFPGSLPGSPAKVRWRNSARPECLSYKEEAGGSNPSASTKCDRSSNSRAPDCGSGGGDASSPGHPIRVPVWSNGEDRSLSRSGRQFDSPPQHLGRCWGPRSVHGYQSLRPHGLAVRMPGPLRRS